MNTKNTKMNTNMKKSTPEVAKAADTKTTAKADRPKLTAAYIKEMVAKGLSPLTGKPIRHYSRTGKRYAGKTTDVKAVKAESKVKAGEAIQNVVTDVLAEAEKATKPAIPVLKAKKTVKATKKA